MPIDERSPSTFSSPYNPAFFQPAPNPSAPEESMPSTSNASVVPNKKQTKNDDEMFATLVNYAIMGIAMATFAKLYELKSCFDWFLVGSFIITVYRAFAKPTVSKQLDEIKQHCSPG
jgi:hypothetical protein